MFLPYKGLIAFSYIYIYINIIYINILYGEAKRWTNRTCWLCRMLEMADCLIGKRRECMQSKLRSKLNVSY